MGKEKKDSTDKLKGIICQDCLSSADEKGLDQYMYHWVQMPAGYQGLFCDRCITKYELIPIHPYTKKPGRKKGSKNEKSDK